MSDSLFNEVWRLRDFYRQLADHNRDQVSLENVGHLFHKLADRLDELLAAEMGAEHGPDDLLRPTAATWVCDGCMRTLVAGQVGDFCDGDHVLCHDCCKPDDHCVCGPRAGTGVFTAGCRIHDRGASKGGDNRG